MTGETTSQSLYLDLMQKCLTNTIYEDPPQDKWSGGTYNPKIRANGLDWPSKAHTMIGSQRMRNLRTLTEYVIINNIPGDLIEAGVWRGGACIYMRAILKAFGVTDRVVWCADSFEGLPEPDAEQFPQDAGDVHHTFEPLKVSLERVKNNFIKYTKNDEKLADMALAIFQGDISLYEYKWKIIIRALYVCFRDFLRQRI